MSLLLAIALLASNDCAEMPTNSQRDVCRLEVQLVQAEERLEKQFDASMILMRAKDEAWDGVDRTGYKGSYADALTRAQNDWLVYADSQCIYEGLEWRGGTMQEGREAMCQTRLTEERIKVLKAWGEAG